jgi:predicted acylesterase/phospholipase RssA
MGNYIYGTNPADEILSASSLIRSLREERDPSFLSSVVLPKIEGWNKDSLCFSGGGVCGVAHVGVLRALDDLGLYKKCNNFSGASVGSIVAVMCALRSPVQQIEQLMDFDFISMLDDDYGIVRDNWRLWYEKGYYKGDALLEKINHCITVICDNPNLTFAELEKYGTTLFVPVTKVWKSHCETQIYSIETTPNESIAMACRMSCTYPAVFRSLLGTSDGGLFCNYPIQYLPENKRFGIRFAHPCVSTKEETKDLGEYLASIIGELHRRTDVMVDTINTLVIPVNMESTNFSISKEERTELHQVAYKATIDHFCETWNLTGICNEEFIVADVATTIL